MNPSTAIEHPLCFWILGAGLCWFTRLFGGSPFAEAERFCSAVLRAGDAGMVRVEAINRGALCAGIRDVLTADAHFATVQLGFRTLP
jgi:hypothetical protein